MKVMTLNQIYMDNKKVWKRFVLGQTKLL